MADLGEAAWTGMVCIETANAGADARTLAPGDSHVLEAVIAVEPDSRTPEPPMDANKVKSNLATETHGRTRKEPRRRLG